MKHNVIKLTREYPTIGGIPVDPKELNLPASRLDLDYQGNFNNHHWNFTKRQFGALAIAQTFRNLDRFQTVLPRDTHQELHRRFEPVKHLPDLVTMLDVIDEERQNNGLIKLGSANNPIYQPISPELFHDLMLEYNEVA